MSDAFTVELNDTQVRVRLSGMPEKLRAALVRKTTQLRLQLEAKSKANAPVVTGRLRRSIASDQEASGNTVEGRVFTSSDVPYARYVEEGTRPHIIEAKGKALAFVMGGKQVFAKRVHHPGTAANPFLKRSLAEMKTEIVEGYREAVRSAL